MNDRFDRRRFLRIVGGGAALVSLPGWADAGLGRSALLRRPGAAAGGSYFDRFGVTEPILRRVLDRGLSLGGDFCEIYLQHSVNHGLGLEDGQVNRASAVVNLGAGIRVLLGDATGFAYCEDLTEEALLAAAATAAAVADSGKASLAPPLVRVRHRCRYPVIVPWDEVGVAQKLPLVQAAEQAARAVDPRIRKVRAFFSDETSRILVANSEGLLTEDDRPMTVLTVGCTGRQGERTEAFDGYLSLREDPSYWTVERSSGVGRETAEKTVLLFDAVPAPVGEMPVVLASSTSGILLHEAIGHPLEADFNRKGVSIYSGRIGQRVADRDVTIVDDGTMGRLRGTLTIDDEGFPAQRTVLVEKGILRSYLHDRISSIHYGVAPTGSGRRESFRFPPVPRQRNTLMLSGPRDPQEIIASVERGLYAERFSNGQVDIGAGDFTFYLLMGRLIEKGRLTSVVKDVNLIGNGPKVLERIDLVGSDLGMYEGGGTCGKDGQSVPVTFGLPTVRVKAVTVGGRKA